MESIPSLEDLLRVARDAFRKEFKAEPNIAAMAPGRVNLIGEHTDYSDGFVMPMALPLRTVMVGAASSSSQIRVVTLADAVDDPKRVEFSPPTADALLSPGSPKWANYLKGAIANYRGFPKPFDAVIATSVPIGGGLSSSASLEVAVFTFLEALHPDKEKVTPQDKALACQEAEHTFAKMPCGVMDQFIAVMGKEHHALMIDCRSLSAQLIPVQNPALAVLITNSNVHHELSSSEYPVRRAQCEAAAKALGVVALRDATLNQLEEKKAALEDVVYRRARHVISENNRVADSVEVLKKTDFTKFGQLMRASHESLKSDFEVSCAELDQLVEIANGVDGVYGSRMTGGGFGGCTVTLVMKTAVEKTIAEIKSNYKGTPTFFVCNASDGAVQVTDVLTSLK